MSQRNRTAARPNPATKEKSESGQVVASLQRYHFGFAIRVIDGKPRGEYWSDSVAESWVNLAADHTRDIAKLVKASFLLIWSLHIEHEADHVKQAAALVSESIGEQLAEVKRELLKPQVPGDSGWIGTLGFLKRNATATCWGGLKVLVAAASRNHPPLAKIWMEMEFSSFRKEEGSAINAIGWIYRDSESWHNDRVHQRTEKKVQQPEQEGDPFLKEAIDVFQSLHKRSMQLTRKELIERLQEYLDSKVGQSFEPEVNRQWANLLDEFLKCAGLRVACIGPTCSSPAYLRFSIRSGAARAYSQFITEHLNENAKQVRHGGPISIPQIHVVVAPLVLDRITPKPRKA